MSTVLKKMGDSVGLIIPQQTLDDVGLQAGDEVDVVSKDGGIFLKSSDEEFARQAEIGRAFMDHYNVALKKLAE